VRALRAAAVGILVGAALLAPARAEETPADRLARLGVDEPLRQRIRAALDRGVTYLLGRQRPDGSFRDATAFDPDHQRMDTTLLCAGALRTADGARTDRAVARALDWTRGTAKGRRWHLENVTDSAAFALVVLTAHPERRIEMGPLLAFVLRQQEAETDWWRANQAIWQKSSGEREHGTANLASSALALAGLRAARDAGLEVPRDAVTRHAAALVRRQGEDGRWPWLPYPPETVWEKGEPDDARGHGILGAAAARLALSLLDRRHDEGLARTLERSLSRGAPALAADWRTLVESLEMDERLGTGWLSLRYSGSSHLLWPLRVACDLGDLSEIAGEPWYPPLARRLLALQREDGGWTTVRGPKALSSETRTAHALLFLGLDDPSPGHPAGPPVTPGVGPGAK
jgi:hypothetical protein